MGASKQRAVELKIVSLTALFLRFSQPRDSGRQKAILQLDITVPFFAYSILRILQDDITTPYIIYRGDVVILHLLIM